MSDKDRPVHSYKEAAQQICIFSHNYVKKTCFFHDMAHITFDLLQIYDSEMTV